SDIAVAATAPMKALFYDENRNSTNRSPDPLMSADVVVVVGQYCMPSGGQYTLNADIKAIRVHPVPEDLGRNWPLDLGIVSDEATFLTALNDALPRRKRDKWADEIAGARKKYDATILDQYEKGVKYSKDTNHLHPFVIAKEVHD